MEEIFEVNVDFFEPLIFSLRDNKILKEKPYLINKVRQGEMRLSRFLKILGFDDDKISTIVKKVKLSGTYKIQIEPPTFLQSRDYIPRKDDDSCFVNLYLGHIDKAIHPHYIEFFGGKLFLVDGNEIEGRFLGIPSYDGSQWLYFNHYGLDTELFLQLIKEMHRESLVNIREIFIDRGRNIYFNEDRAFIANLKDDLNDFFIRCPNCRSVISIKDMFKVDRMHIKHDATKEPYYRDVIEKFIMYIRGASYLFLGAKVLYELLDYYDYSSYYSGRGLGFCGGEEDCNDCCIHEIDCIIAVSKFLIWNALNKFKIYMRCIRCYNWGGEDE
ncbi:MAG: hypothetical protein ABIM18_08180 [candidate division WOR-3 bacterium]